MLPEEVVSNPVRFADKFLDETLDRLDKAHAPVWAGQVEMGKTFVTLATAALIFSISIVQLSAAKVPHPHWGLLLPTSWILFGITVVAGALRQGWASHGQSLRANLEPLRGEIRTKIAALNMTPDFAERFDRILSEAIDKASEKPRRGLRIHDAMTGVMMVAFSVGLVSLITFGIRNLPF